MAAPPDPPPADSSLTLPLPGLPTTAACDFPIRIDATGSKVHSKEFTDAEGNPVRIIKAGKGATLTFTNLNTLISTTVDPSGSVERTVINPDGTSTVTLSGHNVLILFSTDSPAGPSTVQYTGRVVYTVDQNGNFTVESTSGRQRDICAEID